MTPSTAPAADPALEPVRLFLNRELSRLESNARERALAMLVEEGAFSPWNSMLLLTTMISSGALGADDGADHQ